MKGTQEPTGRTIEDLGLCLVTEECRASGHATAHADLPRSKGDPTTGSEICVTCTEQSGRLEGLRLWQSVCPCCFSTAFPNGLPTIEQAHQHTFGSPATRASAPTHRREPRTG